MATKDERPGLLSKVAMFVRNPTKDWSELDQIEQPQEAGYDKQALKAMIERKRQNDFVRKREFDQLRKLRNRDPGAMAGMARPSFFQTSMPTDPDGRAITLKKIDEIEAQMSKQWWKGKQDAATQPNGVAAASPAPAPVAPDLLNSLLPSQSTALASVPFAQTEPLNMKTGDDATPVNEFAATQMSHGLESFGFSGGQSGAASDSNANAAGFAHSDLGFSTSRLFAIDTDEMATDPELEEAAIRFANCDDAGSEQGLLDALRGNELQPEAAQSWAAALLDLYRATGQRAKFEGAKQEFALHLDGAVPMWIDLAALATTQPASPAQAVANSPAATWSSPRHLNLAGMEALRDAMAAVSMPWSVDWSPLETIAPDAMPLLDGLFGSLCEEPAYIYFSGGERLVRALRLITPSGDRSVESSWWQTRLNVLRTLRMHDEFELAALDYCVTFEVAPPPWEEAMCHLNESPGDSGGPVTMPAENAPMLVGELLGDVSQTLAAIDTLDVSGAKLVIQCAALLRVDFAAAGSILNWVAMRQAEGKFVQFHDTHRLVAAFFNVIGINEHAKVIPRPI